MAPSSRRLSKIGVPAEHDHQPEHDDDAERERLRAQREKRRQSHTPIARRRLSSAPGRGENEARNMADLYDQCIKLSAENKINRQNTWDLNLIDHIDDVIGNTGANTNFQKASCTLDASVKIYAYRVDSVHHDMFKVLGGLNRTEQKGEDEDLQEETQEDSGGVASQPGKSRQRQRQLQLTNHLEQREGALTTSLPDLLFEVDPMFQRTASSFDEGGAKGLLLNQLSVGSHCHIMFDFSTAIDIESEGDSCNSLDVELPANFSQHWRSIYSPDMQISPLTAMLRSALLEMKGVVNEGVVHDQYDDGELAERQNFEDGGFEDDDDPDMAPLEQQSESNDQDFFDHDNHVLPDENIDQNGLNTNSLDINDENINSSNFGEMASAGVEQPSSPNDPRRYSSVFTTSSVQPFIPSKNWAGPGISTSHWKFRGSGSDSQPAVTEEESLGSKLRKTRISFEIDFSTPEITEADIPGAARSNNVLTKQSWAKYESLNHLLPKDLHIDSVVLFKLFHHQHFMMKSRSGQSAAASGPDPDTGFAVDYDDQQFGLGDGLDDGDDGFSPDPDLIPGVSGLFTSEFEFVAQPVTADKIEIDFAKSAKKVDIKAVKQSLWSSLSETTKNAPPIAAEECQNRVAAHCANNVESGNQVEPLEAELWPSFTDTIQSVPVPESSKDAMSVQLYFICLLHLANENDLVLKPGQTPLGDFSIARRAINPDA